MAIFLESDRVWAYYLETSSRSQGSSRRIEALDSTNNLPMEAPVTIEPYSAAWAVSFSVERALFARTLGPWLVGPIEHVGSTAVPGLPAKPIIDIMAAVKSLEASKPALARLCESGYCYFPYRDDVMHWLCKPSPELRTHHLHLVPFQSALWIERLTFRDALAEDSALANEYAALKYRLADTYRYERELYTEAKGPFIERVLRERRMRRNGAV